MIAAGVGDDAAVAFLVCERGDFVIGSAEFEGADGLLVFRFEKQAAWVFSAELEFDEFCADGDIFEAPLGGAEVRESEKCRVHFISLRCAAVKTFFIPSWMRPVVLEQFRNHAYPCASNSVPLL